jgi:hypothetical protein
MKHRDYGNFLPMKPKSANILSWFIGQQPKLPKQCDKHIKHHIIIKKPQWLPDMGASQVHGRLWPSCATKKPPGIHRECGECSSLLNQLDRRRPGSPILTTGLQTCECLRFATTWSISVVRNYLVPDTLRTYIQKCWHCWSCTILYPLCNSVYSWTLMLYCYLWGTTVQPSVREPNTVCVNHRTALGWSSAPFPGFPVKSQDPSAVLNNCKIT